MVLTLYGEWVMRIPRSELSIEELEKEIELLPELGPALPVAIPRFEHVSRRPRYVVYRLIRGEPLRDEDPDGVRAFLDALHAFDAGDLRVPRPGWPEIYRAHVRDWRRVVTPLLDADERRRGDALLERSRRLRASHH